MTADFWRQFVCEASSNMRLWTTRAGSIRFQYRCKSCPNAGTCTGRSHHPVLRVVSFFTLENTFLVFGHCFGQCRACSFPRLLWLTQIHLRSFLGIFQTSGPKGEDRLLFHSCALHWGESAFVVTWSWCFGSFAWSFPRLILVGIFWVGGTLLDDCNTSITTSHNSRAGIPPLRTPAPSEVIWFCWAARCWSFASCTSNLLEQIFDFRN